MSTLWSVVLVS